MFNRKPGAKGDRGEALPPPNEGPPDSDNPGGMCPRCARLSSFDRVGEPLPLTFETDRYALRPDGGREELFYERATVFRCRYCGHGIVVVEEQWIGGKHHSESRGGEVTWKGIHWWPIPGAQVSSDVPPAIAAVFSEAVRALSAQCPRASVVMARRTVEAIAVEKGEVAGPLGERLKKLEGQGILLPTVAVWAKEIRLLGNVGAHFDPIQDVSQQEATELLRFVRELLKHLYELPAQLDRLRKP